MRFLLAIVSAALLGLFPLRAAIADPAFWVVADEDTTVYVLGTIHVLTPGQSWLTPAIETGLGKAEAVIFEASLGELKSQAPALVHDQGVLPEGRQLSDTMTPQGYAALRSYVEGFGANPDELSRLRPWVTYTGVLGLFLQAKGLNQTSGVDYALERLALAGGKPLMALESPSEQAQAFSRVPDKVMGAFLSEEMLRIDAWDPELDAMIEAWVEGDLGMIARISEQGRPQFPQVIESLLDRRNRIWADQLAAFMDPPGTYFLAVGVGHLVGEASLLNLLKKRGFAVRRLQ